MAHTKYPTVQEILKHKTIFKKEEIATMIIWKTMWYKAWNKKSKTIKNQTLIQLVKDFIESEEELVTPNVKLGNQYAYHEEYYNDYNDEYDDPAIELDKKNPSIISTLHEIAHWKLGSSELKACQWSTQLFKKCFKQSFKSLKWDGHLLVKR